MDELHLSRGEKKKNIKRVKLPSLKDIPRMENGGRVKLRIDMSTVSAVEQKRCYDRKENIPDLVKRIP